MGRRGPHADVAPKWESDGPEESIELPWEKAGLSRAAKVIAFLEWLPVTKGMLVGENIKLLPFQLEFIEAIYGPSNEDGTRTVREAVLSVARKNGKTTLLAGLCWCHLSGPMSEKNGECYSAAKDKDQAAALYREMTAMRVERPWLWHRTYAKDHTKMIVDRKNGSFYLSLSRDAKKLHGTNTSFAVCDELAQWPNRELYDVLDTSTGARDEPLLISISTQSADPHGIMSELLDYAADLNAGKTDDPTFIGRLFCVAEDADIFDEKEWPKANPALGEFRQLGDLRRKAKKAQFNKAQEPAFRNLCLNQKADLVVQLLPRLDWEACGGAFDTEMLLGLPAYVGVDLSVRRDLTAIVVVVPYQGLYYILPYCWLPAFGLKEKEREDKVPYLQWVKDGHLLTTPGRSVRFSTVAPTLREIFDDFDIRAFAYDRYRMNDLASALAESELFDIEFDDSKMSIEGLEAENFGQGTYSMAPAVDFLEAACIDHELRHADHPVLTWCAGNVKVKTNHVDERVFEKQKSHGRIDAIVAAAMALRMAQQMHTEESGPSVYEKRGLRAF